MWKRKRPPKPRPSTLALGKICGCGTCRYCHAYQAEQILERMDDEVRNGARIAAEARAKILQQMKESDDDKTQR